MPDIKNAWFRISALFCPPGRRRAALTRRANAGIAVLESLESRQLLTSTLSLVQDINTSGDSNPGWLPRFGINVSFGGTPSFTEMNGVLYFAAYSQAAGQELWRSDGTSQGTWMVHDIYSGRRDSSPANLTNVGGALYFTAKSSSGKVGLWTSDGTSDGTRQILLSSGVQLSDPQNLASFNGKLFFTADADAGRELWESDGTTSGTFMVEDIRIGPDSSSPSNLTVMGNTLYFTAYDPAHGASLRGLSATDIRSRIIMQDLAVPKGLVSGGDKLFFLSEYLGNDQLYVTDGTPDGTARLTSNFVAAERDNSRMAFMDGYLYFVASDDRGFELWRTNGTQSGTSLVKDINPGASHSFINELTVVDHTLFFSASSTADENQELWRSDGTESGTQIVGDIRPGALSSNLHNFVAGNGILYFVASDGIHGSELWESDGTENGTILVSDLLPGPGSTNLATIGWQEPRLLMNAGNHVFLSATNGELGHELYVVSSSPLLSIIAPGPTTSDLAPTFAWTPVNEAVSYELWISNISTGSATLRVEATSATYRSPLPLGIGRFEFSVRAKFADGTFTPWSAVFSLTITTPVTFVSVTRRQNTSRPTLSWSVLHGAVKYDLRIDNTSTGEAQVVRNVNLTSTTWVSSLNLPLGQYRAWARGIDAQGNAAAWSEAIDFGVVPAPELNSLPYATFNHRLSIRWAPVTGAATYQISVRNLKSGVSVYSVKNISTTYWTPPANLPDGSYRWRVQAISVARITSLWSAPADIAIGGRTTVISPVGASKDATPTFRWQPVQGAVRYELRVTKATTQTLIISRTKLTGATYTPSANLPKGSYRVWVRAVSVSGKYAVWSGAVIFTVVDDSQLKSKTDQPNPTTLIGKRLTLTPESCGTERGSSLFRRDPENGPPVLIGDESGEDSPVSKSAAAAQMPFAPGILTDAAGSGQGRYRLLVGVIQLTQLSQNAGALPGDFREIDHLMGRHEIDV